MKFITLILIFVSLIYANDTNDTNETNSTDNNLSQSVWTFKKIDPFIPPKNMQIAILISKKKFFKYIPELMNSLNAYLIKKDVSYSLKLIDTPADSNLTSILNDVTKQYTYIFAYFSNIKKLQKLTDYPYNYFFIPTINKEDTNITSNNIFFGGINYNTQISELNNKIDGFTIIYNSKNLSISQKLLNKESNILTFPYKTLYFENRRFKNRIIKDSNLILNTNAVMSAQILSNLTFYNNTPSKIFSTQINYNPLIFTLNQTNSIKNMIIASSISKSNPIIKENNLLLNSNIQYNWLNFSSSVLMNLAYNLETDYDGLYANDFYLYLFNNQINYKTNLYQIKRNGFEKIKEQK